MTKYEIEIEIQNLNSKKSPGYDGISSQVIKTIAKEISEPLSHRENRSTEHAVIELVDKVSKAIDRGEYTI